MLEPALITNKKLNKETERFIGQVQLQRFSNFLEHYNRKINAFKARLPNNFNTKLKPITVTCKPSEDITLLQLIHSDNKLLTRIFISLASICNEISTLTKEAKEFYNILMFYDEEDEKGIENLEKISKLLDTLQKISFFSWRSQEVIILLLKQLCALLGKEFYSGSSSSIFPEPLDAIGELLICFVTLSSLLNSNKIKNHFRLYQRAIRHMLHNPSEYNMERDALQCLYRQLNELEMNLLSSSILQSAIAKCNGEALTIGLKSCSLSNEFTLYIQHLVTELERDDEHVSFTQIWLQANTLLVFQQNLFGNVEKKLLKRLLEINKKNIACTLYGNILWYPDEFLQQHVPTLIKNETKWSSQNRTAQIASRCQSLTKESQLLTSQACQWIIGVEFIAKTNMSQFKITKKICELIKWVTNLHANEGRPMTKTVLLALCKLIEVLKGFRFVFDRNMLRLTYMILLISQHLNHKALCILANVKKSLKQERSYKEQHLDVLSALVVAEHALKGPNTDGRILLTRLSLSASGLGVDALYEIRSIVSKLEIITNAQYLLNTLCDCSFLYWHRVILPVYLTKQIQSRIDLTRFYLLFSALADCSETDSSNLSTVRMLSANVIDPLSQLIETNLRLQTHLHLQLPPTDPIQCPPPRGCGRLYPALLDKTYIDIKQEIEHYLGSTFYNLTTVVLHDWKTYGEMRRLAFLQYDLNVVDSDLPMQTLEQGLDVLEIMRNINVFVERYLYNLNNQVFVEEWSDNKHLNTINISHIANSIRTHGIGIMNTTVNFTYQFLQNKFHVFSQFMFDELIKSRLLKDIRFFAENKTELDRMYPFERAEKFNFGIRKLGLNRNNLSYLDLFRKLIAQIGNAMGYVRLIRSGGRRCLADATCFIPDLKTVNDFTDVLETAELPELPKIAADCLRHDIKNLVDNFEEATEYFKLLVNVFAPVFRDPRNLHLRNFYIIVPPLTINFVEHSLTCKERLNKKNREGAAFTDDGFAMGLAYIIELLEQSAQFNSLRWFESVKAKILRERTKLKTQRGNASRDDEKLQQTLSLTEKRVNSLDNEFQLLYYNISSARIFFQS
ncbi:hypothetical protein Trydic_g21021 [Trypoxylus dichotomus]